MIVQSRIKSGMIRLLRYHIYASLTLSKLDYFRILEILSSMATVSAFSSPAWPNHNPNSNPNPTSGSQPDPPLLSPHDHGDITQSLDSFSSMTIQDDDPSRNSDRHLDLDRYLNVHSPASSPQNLTPNFLATPPPSLLHLSFNQDHACFAAGTDSGFRIYNCDPFREIFRRDFDRGSGVSVLEMLFRCNILAFVGGGHQPQYPPNKVMIWDDHQSCCIGELSFMSIVKSVRLRRDRIVVVLEQKISVYNFANLNLMHQIDTIANPKGLCAVSQGAGSMVLVCPGMQKGQVRVEHYASRRTRFIMAHDSRIACFALTPVGDLLATASTKGTLVRVFNTADGTLLQEVRRGADRAEIYSLAFSANAQWLAVSSDKGTVHVFSLKVNDTSTAAGDAATHSPSSSLSLLRGVLPKYFSSEWSVAQFRLVEGSQYLAAFGHQRNTIIILGMDGSFYRCQFDPVRGGEMTQLEYHNFLTPPSVF